jgi:shikimate kinase
MHEDIALDGRNRRSRERLLDRHIALVGFMGAGKSSLGGPLAAALERPFFDSDDGVEKLTGQTVRELFASRSEAEFRELEAKAIAEILAGPPSIVSLGGGALQTKTTRALVSEHCFVVHLYVSWPEIRAALPELSADRPLLQRPLGEIHSLYIARQRTYRHAHVRVHVARDDIDTAVRQVLAALRRSGSPPEP